SPDAPRARGSTPAPGSKLPEVVGCPARAGIDSQVRAPMELDVESVMKKSKLVRRHESQLGLEPPEGVQVFAEDGTDLSQVRQMLAMTPSERLRYVQSLAQSVVRMRRAAKLS
ncbi:MAG: hypothetical protein AAGI01_07975, partial [Myxococcota bacterium]